MPEFHPRVVARFTNGEVIRGTSGDFRPDRQFFHIYEEGSPIPLRILKEDLKAVFFVRSLEGDPDLVEGKRFGVRMHEGRKIWVEFLDGEELAGWSPDYDKEVDGFFLYPADPRSNAEKAYLPRKSLKRVRLDEHAEKASLEFVEPERRPRVRRVDSKQWDLFLGDASPRAERSPFPPPRSKRPPAAAEEASESESDSDPFLGDW